MKGEELELRVSWPIALGLVVCFFVAYYFIDRPYEKGYERLNRLMSSDEAIGVVLKKETGLPGNYEELTLASGEIFSWGDDIECYGFYEKIHIGDSIVKEKGSLELKVFRADTFFVIDLASKPDSPIGSTLRNNSVDKEANGAELTVLERKDSCFCSVEEISKMGVKLVWGHGPFVRIDTLKNLYYYQKLFCSEKRQVLLFDCGLPCDALVILPMDNKIDSIQVLLDPLSHSENYDYVVGLSSEREHELIVYDLKNKTQKKIMIEMDSCRNGFYFYCLDIEFEGDSCFRVEIEARGESLWKLDSLFNASDGANPPNK